MGSKQNVYVNMSNAGTIPFLESQSPKTAPMVEVPGQGLMDIASLEPREDLLRENGIQGVPSKNVKSALRGEFQSLEEYIQEEIKFVEPIEVETFVNEKMELTYRSTTKKTKKIY